MAAPSPTLLLVEDNRADVFLFEEGLRKHGLSFRVVHFENGETALSYLREGPKPPERPDVIVLDLHLPGISGGEVLREIRDEPWLAGVPISIISGAPPEHVERLDLAGSHAFIHKSIHVAEFQIGRAHV